MGRRKAKLPMGRPPHEPTDLSRSTVRILVAAGLTQEQIAERLDLSVNTLVKHYDHDLKVGWTEAVGDAATVILSKMRDVNGDDALDAAKFFLTRRGRGLWSEQKNVEISGPGGGAIPVAQINLDALDYDALEELDNLLAPAFIEGEAVEVDADRDD